MSPGEYAQTSYGAYHRSSVRLVLKQHVRGHNRAVITYVAAAKWG